MKARSWMLDEASLRRLLDWLSPDPVQSPQRYLALRERLIRVFEWRGVPDCLHLVDEVFDRTARRLEEGAIETSADPYSYLYRVALFVLREHWTRVAKSALAAPKPPLEEVDSRLLALDACLDGLSEEDRELVLAYYSPDRRGKILARKELAARLGISENALRIRMHRLRAKLENCVRDRLADGETA